MAENIILKFQQEGLDKLTADVNASTSAIGNMTDFLNKVGDGTISATKAIKVFEDEIKRLTLAGEQNSVAYENASNILKELSKSTDNASKHIKSLKSNTAGLDQAIRIVSTMTAGFGLLQGATALAGSNNEDLQKTLVKVNSAMLILSSLQQIQNELTQEDTKLKIGLTTATNLWTWATTGTTLAMKALRIAILATGIGAFIVGLGLLIANFDKVKEAVINLFPSLGNIPKLWEDIKVKTLEVISQIVPRIKQFASVISDIFTLNWGKIKDDWEKGSAEAAKAAKAASDKFYKEKSTDGAISWYDAEIEKMEYAVKELKAKGKDLESAKKAIYLKQLQESRARLLATNKVSADNTKSYKDAQIELLEAERKYAEMLEKQKKDNAKKLEDLAKKAQEATKTRIQKEIDEIKILLNNKNLTDAERLNLERNLVDKEAELAISGLDRKFAITEAGETRIKLIKSEAVKEKEEIEQKYNENIIKKANETNKELDEIESDRQKESIRLGREKLQIAEINDNILLNNLDKNSNEYNKISKQKVIDNANLLIYDVQNSKDSEALKNAKIVEIKSNTIAKLKEMDLDYNKFKEELDIKEEQKKQERQQKRLDIAKQVGEGILNISSMFINAELDALNSQKEQGLISEKKYQQEVRKLKRKQAIIDKAQAVFNIGLNIAESITKAMAVGGPIVGQVLAGISAALGAIQLGIVLAKPIPSFFKGVLKLPLGNNPKGRDTIPAMLHEGESVMTSSETDKYYHALKAMKENNFSKKYIPIEELYKKNINYSVLFNAKKTENIQDINALKNELQYLIMYIKQGNAERIIGNRNLINTIDRTNRNGY